jgi:hypothetical protein
LQPIPSFYFGDEEVVKLRGGADRPPPVAVTLTVSPPGFGVPGTVSDRTKLPFGTFGVPAIEPFNDTTTNPSGKF